MASSDELRSAHDAAVVRAMPPGRTVRWLLDAVGATTVLSCEAMRGASTSAMHRVTVCSDGGASTTVVLRRYVLDSYLVAEPAAVVSEITGLQLAERLTVPTPGLLAVDPTGVHADAPAIAMRALPGRPVWHFGLRQLEQLADALVELHAVDTADVALPPIHRYDQRSFEPPRWATSPTTWERAVQIFHGPIPTRDVTFVHRDFHPGNVLWQRRRISGVVDWQNACLAPRSIDISHCRLNFAYDDPGLPELLRVTWERRSGSTFDPWADVMSIVGGLDNLRDTPPGGRAQETIEAMLTTAVGELGA